MHDRCPHCDAPETVEHVLEHCPHYNANRHQLQQLVSFFNPNVPFNTHTLLGGHQTNNTRKQFRQIAIAVVDFITLTQRPI